MISSLSYALPGEDRDFGGSELYVDLVPSTAFYDNARAVLPRPLWRKLSQYVRDRVDACEACGRTCPASARDAHERWSYDDARGIQRLERLVALCKACHEATHFGLAELQRRGDRAKAHLARVNRWNALELGAHIIAAQQLWAARSQHSWRQDFTILNLGMVAPLSDTPIAALPTAFHAAATVPTGSRCSWLGAPGHIEPNCINTASLGT